MGKTKKILISLMSIAVISGGILIGLRTSESLTWDEFQVLTAIYSYELKNYPLNNIVLNDKIVETLNKIIENRPVLENKIKIGDSVLSKDEYIFLRKALIEKSKNKTIIEKVLNVDF